MDFKSGPMIPLESCKEGYLYIISARNAKIGIFNLEKKGFRISRFKFDRNYDFVEYHWDTGEPHGTARPYTELLKPEPFNSEQEFLDFMNNYMEEHKEEINKSLKESILNDPEDPFRTIMEL